MQNSSHYCLECAKTLGIVTLSIDYDNLNYTGSFGDYQHKKFIKHTLPLLSDRAKSTPLSILNNKDYDTYSGLIKRSVVSGSVEVNPQGKVNLILIEDTEIGHTLANSGTTLINRDKAFKVVFPDNPQKIHGYPTGSNAILGQACMKCNMLILI